MGSRPAARTSPASASPATAAASPAVDVPVGAERPGLVLAVLCCAQLVLVVDSTIVNIANPTIERALGFTQANLQWTVTAYAVTFGGFLLVGGRLADLVGRRRLFMVGMVAFTVASLGAGAARSAVQLIVFRALQGVAGALVSPTTLSLLAATFSEGPRRQRAYGVWATAAAMGGMVGFVLGGFITATLGWRWIFFVNGPIGLLALAGAARWLPTVGRDPGRGRLDLAGAVSVTSALALLLYALSNGQGAGWGSASTVVAFTLTVLLGAGFAVVETRAADPLVPFRLLRRRAAIGNLASALQSTMGASSTFLTALYLQQVFGFSPSRAGVATLPLPVCFALGANVSSRAVHRVGPRRLATGAFLLLTAALAWMARTPAHASYATTLLPALAVLGVGLGAAQVPIINTVTTGVDSAEQGIVAALYNMFQRMGGAVGLAVMATLAAAAAGSVQAGAATEGHGIRTAFAVAALVGVAGSVVTGTGLPRRAGEGPTGPGAGEAVATALSEMPVE